MLGFINFTALVKRETHTYGNDLLDGVIGLMCTFPLLFPSSSGGMIVKPFFLNVFSAFQRISTGSSLTHSVL